MSSEEEQEDEFPPIPINDLRTIEEIRRDYEDADGMTIYDKKNLKKDETINEWIEKGYEKMDTDEFKLLFKEPEDFNLADGTTGKKYKVKNKMRFHYIRTDGRLVGGGNVDYMVLAENGYYVVFSNYFVQQNARKVFNVQLNNISDIYLLKYKPKPKNDKKDYDELHKTLKNANQMWSYVKKGREADKNFMKNITQKGVREYFKNIIQDN